MAFGEVLRISAALQTARRVGGRGGKSSREGALDIVLLLGRSS
jgi:hypothetical protein